MTLVGKNNIINFIVNAFLATSMPTYDLTTRRKATLLRKRKNSSSR